MGEPSVTSSQLGSGNHRVKRLRRLLTSRRARAAEHAFVVEGPAMAAEALDAVEGGAPGGGLVIEGLYVEPGAASDLIERASMAACDVHVLAPGVLRAALSTVNPQPVAMIVTRRPPALDDLGPTGPVLCLVEPRDPGNVGTLIRTAEASGTAGVVLAGESVDPTNPKVVRASAGACLRHPVVVVPDAVAALELLGRHRTLVASVVAPGALAYDQVALAEAVIVLGSEAHGLPAPIVALAAVAVTVPLAGPTESLNVAAAGAVLCFEALRQRRAAGEADQVVPAGNSVDIPEQKRQVCS
jgi:TrmH family RNA methyltransferase